MLTDKMRTAFDYDMFGNSPLLVAAVDVPELMACRRAAGTVICRVCGVTYNIHPSVQGALWATRTCEGIVKL